MSGRVCTCLLMCLGFIGAGVGARLRACARGHSCAGVCACRCSRSRVCLEGTYGRIVICVG